MAHDAELSRHICDIRGWSAVLLRIAAGGSIEWVRTRLRARLGVLGLRWRPLGPGERVEPRHEIRNRELAAALRAGRRAFTHPELLALRQLSQSRDSFVCVDGVCFQPHEPLPQEPVPQQVLHDLSRRVTQVAYSRIWGKVQDAEQAFALENSGCAVDDACFAALRADARLVRAVAANADQYERMYMTALCDDMCESWAKYELSTRISLPYELAVWNKFVRSLPEQPGAGLAPAFGEWRDGFPAAMRSTHTMALAARVVAEADAGTRGESVVAEMETRMRERMLRNFAIEMPALGGAAFRASAARDMRARLDAHGLEYDSLFPALEYLMQSHPAQRCTGSDLQQRLKMCPVGGGVGQPTCACGKRFTPAEPYTEHCGFDCQHAAAVEGNRLAAVFGATEAARPAAAVVADASRDNRLLRKALIFLLHEDAFEDRHRVLDPETVLNGLSRYLAASAAGERACH